MLLLLLKYRCEPCTSCSSFFCIVFILLNILTSVGMEGSLDNKGCNDKLYPLVGLWKVNGIVDDQTNLVVSKKDLSLKIRDLVKRNELIRIVETGNPCALAAFYVRPNVTGNGRVSPSFFLLWYEKERRVVLKAYGEYKVPASYALQAHEALPQHETLRECIWLSQRQGEPPHKIQWVLQDEHHHPAPKSIVACSELPYPIRRWSRRVKDRCQCGKKNCVQTYSKEHVFLNVSKPRKSLTELKAACATNRKREKTIALKALARYYAQYVPFEHRFVTGKTSRISFVHAHPVARPFYQQLNRNKINLTIPRLTLEGRVTSETEIRQYFYHIKELDCYMPKLVYPLETQDSSNSTYVTRSVTRSSPKTPQARQVKQRKLSDEVRTKLFSNIASVDCNQLEQVLDTPSPLHVIAAATTSESRLLACETRIIKLKGEVSATHIKIQWLQRKLGEEKSKTEQLSYKVEELEEKIEEMTIYERKDREFFTEDFHVQGSVNTVKYYFGLTDSFVDLLPLVQGFFRAIKTIEGKHS